MMEPSFFTINACNRCRKRKARCDAAIPACLSCQNSGSVCEFTDSRTRTAHPRSFIRELEDEVARLEKELEALPSPCHEFGSHRTQERPEGRSSTGGVDETGRDVQAHPDLIRLEPGGDAHFLGVSSGMHLARTVLESAQQNAASFDSASSVDRDLAESAQARTQHTLHATLPSREIALNLIEIFVNQYQVQYPILVEDDFVAVVMDYYSRVLDGLAPRDDDMWTRFMLNMVVSIALGSLSRDNPETRVLAQGFSSNAMADLGTVMQTKDLRTLQCLLLLLLSSVLNSSSTPIWYISGLCVRMCVDLGFHSEKTIQLPPRGLDPDDTDSKRRLFWVTYTFDRILSTMLGRPFTLDDNKINVRLPDSSLDESRKPQILHWLKLQRLQSEIVQRLYTSRDTESLLGRPKSDLRAWTAEMTRKLGSWNDGTMVLADSNGHSLDWWRYWHQYALLILYRPSPARPTLDSHGLSKCYTAAKTMVQLSFIRAHKGVADFTWLDLHYHYMSGITLLFLVWKNPEARAAAQDEWTAFKSCLVQWEAVLERLATRWDRVSRARDVLVKLADATVNIVEEKMAKPWASIGRQQNRNKSKENDRRQTIMQQLGSPGAQLSPGQDKPSEFASGPTRYSNINKTAQPSYGDAASFMTGHHSPPDALQSHEVNESVPNRAHDPQLVPSISPGQMQRQSSSPGSWPQGQQQVSQQGLELEADSVFMSQDLSALLSDEIWSGFGTYDSNAAVSGGTFDYFPLPMAVPMPVAGVDFGMGVASMAGRADGLFTESILNFRGALDEDRDMGGRAAGEN